MDRYGRVRSAVEPLHPKPRCQQWRTARSIASALKRLSLEFHCAVQFDAPELGGSRPRARAAACGIGGAQRREYRAECRRVQARQAPLAAHAGLVRLMVCLFAPVCLLRRQRATQRNSNTRHGNRNKQTRHFIRRPDERSPQAVYWPGPRAEPAESAAAVWQPVRCVVVFVATVRELQQRSVCSPFGLLRMGSGSSNVRFCATSSSIMPAGCTPSASRSRVQRA